MSPDNSSPGVKVTRFAVQRGFVSTIMDDNQGANSSGIVKHKVNETINRQTIIKDSPEYQGQLTPSPTKVFEDSDAPIVIRASKEVRKPGMATKGLDCFVMHSLSF